MTYYSPKGPSLAFNNSEEESLLESSANTENQECTLLQKQMCRISFYVIQIGITSIILLLSLSSIKSITYYTFHVIGMGIFAILLFFSA